MGLGIKISLEGEGGEFIRDFIDGLDGKTKGFIQTAAATEALKELRKYYRGFGTDGGWEDPSLATHGPGRQSTNFATRIIEGWNYFVKRNANEFELIHEAEDKEASILAHKVRGGDIKAKEAKALTIPLVPEAHGKRTSEYESSTGRELFKLPRDGQEGSPEGTLVEEVGGSKLRAVYLLRTEVTQKEWPGALPPNELIANAAVRGMYLAIDSLIK